MNAKRSAVWGESPSGLAPRESADTGSASMDGSNATNSCADGENLALDGEGLERLRREIATVAAVNGR